MNKRRTLLYGIFISGVFLYIDQWLKWQSLHAWDTPVFVTSWFGWLPFLNEGVAFGLPLPITFVSMLTIPLLVVLFMGLVRAYRHDVIAARMQLWGYMAIITGALSNLYDRLVYQKTVDYLLISTGVINLADIAIVVGFIALSYSFSKQKSL